MVLHGWPEQWNDIKRVLTTPFSDEIAYVQPRRLASPNKQVPYTPNNADLMLAITWATFSIHVHDQPNWRLAFYFDLRKGWNVPLSIAGSLLASAAWPAFVDLTSSSVFFPVPCL